MSSSEAAIDAVLAESGPDHDGFSLKTPGGGNQSDVYLVTVSVGDEEFEVVVKFKPDGDAPFEVEPRLHDYVAERTAVPVPRILVYEADPPGDLRPHFITERVRGENLAEAFPTQDMAARERILHQVGQLLGDLHTAIGFTAFGRLDFDRDRLIVSDWIGSWRTHFERLTRMHVDRLETTPFANLAERAWATIEPNLATVPEGGVPRLVHDDFRLANLLFEPGAEAPITAVLDWQDVLAALPEYNLAQTEFLFIDSSVQDGAAQTRLREAFHGGYSEYRDRPPDDGYRERRPLYQLSTLLWRMAGFEAAFEDTGGLAQARAEAQYRQQFERLTDRITD